MSEVYNPDCENCKVYTEGVKIPAKKRPCLVCPHIRIQRTRR